MICTDRNRCYSEGGHKTSCCISFWDVGHKGHLQELQLKARNMKWGIAGCGTECEAEYEPQELPLHSDVSFQLLCSHFPRNVCHTNIYVQQNCRINAPASSCFSCPHHSTVIVDILHYNLKIIVHQSTETNMAMVSNFDVTSLKTM